MARIRSVHPGLFTDEAFVSCSPLARLLFIGTWTEADDAGAFEWKPLQLKMRVLPVDNVDTAKLLDELVAANMIKRYSVNGREFGLIRNFGRFQRPKKPKSLHPIPVEFRTYACWKSSGSEPDGEEDGAVPKKSELVDLETGEVLRKSRISPQMEDGGWRKNPSRDESPGLGSIYTGRGSIPSTPNGSDQADDWDAVELHGDADAA